MRRNERERAERIRKFVVREIGGHFAEVVLWGSISRGTALREHSDC